MSKHIKKKARPKSSKKSWRRKMLKYAVLIGLWKFVMLLFVLAYFAKDLPDLDNFAKTERQPVIMIYDQHNNLLAKYGDMHGKTLRYNQIPTVIINAVLAAEDHRFFDHFGIDIIGIIRAYFANIVAGKVTQGGSTITQQLAKIAYLGPERTLTRKIKELMIALQLESKFTKEQILSMYLNRVYLGRGVYGVEAATRFYFQKPIDNVSVFEAAILAGMLKAPSRYSPANNKAAAIARGKVVLNRMHQLGYITKLVFDQAMVPNFKNTSVMLAHPYFADYVLSELGEIVPSPTTDLKVITSLDINLQHKLERSIQDAIAKSKSSLSVDQASGISMNLNGEIKAMVGGVDYQASSYNRAVNAKRQAGSLFKYFVYAAAMENGFSIDDVFEDKPLAISQGVGRSMWRPQNIDKKYRGEMTLNKAFANSINTIAVQLSEEVGRQNVINMAKDMGVASHIENYPSVALGVTDVSLIEMVNSFAVTANNGYIKTPHAILSIEQSGEVVYQSQFNVFDMKVLSDEAVYKMKSLLLDVVQIGSGKAAKLPGKLVYGKTGTTQDYRDAWFVGFTDDLVTGIWVGNDNNTHMNKVVGGGLPVAIWHSYMR